MSFRVYQLEIIAVRLPNYGRYLDSLIEWIQTYAKDEWNTNIRNRRT